MLKKELPMILLVSLVSVIVGEIAIKISPIFYESSTHINQSKAFYKEEFINDIELSIPNSDITKNSQISDTSKIENSSSSISEDIKPDIIFKPDNTNNTQTRPNQSKVSFPIKTSNTTEKSDSNVNAKPASEVNSPNKSQTTIERVDENTSSISEINPPTIYYDRTTSIYDDDNETLLRVEYYSNNRLVYYSDIEQFDVKTKSYIEKIYQWNYEKNIEILIRTDIYSNGRLINSY